MLCQYNNINVNLHQYLKEKKRKKKEKKKGLMKPKHYCSYSALTVQELYSDIYKREKKKYKQKTKKKKKKVANQNGTVDEQ